MKPNIRNMLLVSLFASLMVVGAFVRIPFPLLPVTLQPFFCAFAGILLGSRLGAVSQAVYVILGLTGLPVFAQGGGVNYIFNPTFGFLLGFIAGAYVTGKVAGSLRTLNLKNCMFSVMSGLVTIYSLGIVYMFMILHFYMGKQDAGIWFVITTNIPYIIKDFVLYIVVAFTANSAIPALKKAGLA